LQEIPRIQLRDRDKVRRFLNGVLFMARTGCQWRALPRKYGDWRAVHKRYKRWCDRGVWAHIFQEIKGELDKEIFMIDATIIRAHACAAGQAKDSADIEALGRSCGGFSTKIHGLVDALGNPVSFSLTAGPRHDKHGIPLTKDLADTTLLADKGYDSDAFLKKLKKKGVQAVIPPKKTEK
jgi:transposase